VSWAIAPGVGRAKHPADSVTEIETIDSDCPFVVALKLLAQNAEAQKGGPGGLIDRHVSEARSAQPLKAVYRPLSQAG
jgi:hypothetical protein